MQPLERSKNTEFQYLNIRQLISRNEETTHHLKVKPDWTIERVKRLISALFSIPVDQQRLLFKQKRLADDKTLEDCEIGNNATIQLVPNRVFPATREPLTRIESNVPDLSRLQISEVQPFVFSAPLNPHRAISPSSKANDPQ